MSDLTLREVELKSVVDDLALRRRRVEAAGADLVFAGRLEDRRYDTADGQLTLRDDMLRLRVYRNSSDVRAELTWKGPTRYERGYKVRDEVAVGTDAADALAELIERLGFRVIREIDREVFEYRLADAMIRFERYPRMDVLVEVEGSEDAIERAIETLGMPRSGFTAERLPDFVARYEARTGRRAALCDGELKEAPRQPTGDA